jgi:hypothetical protein
MEETNIVASWLYTTLHGDATLLAAAPGGVYEDAAPRGTVFPVVIFALQDAIDSLTVNGVCILVRATYQVKVVTQGASYAALDGAAARINTLLHRVTGSAGGGAIYSSVRVEPLRYREDADGVEYRHLGGLYEIQVK